MKAILFSGVNDKRIAAGIEPEAVEQMKKDIVTTINIKILSIYLS